jgi:hypothetical protein
MKMTKQEIAELLLKANDDCSNVEILCSDGVWKNTEQQNIKGIIWHITNDYQYRIKPEPEYAPYTENDAREFLGEKFVNIKYGHMIIVVDYGDDGVWFPEGGRNYSCNYSDLLKNYTKLDGTPAGRRVE